MLFYELTDLNNFSVVDCWKHRVSNIVNIKGVILKIKFQNTIHIPAVWGRAASSSELLHSTGEALVLAVETSYLSLVALYWKKNYIIVRAHIVIHLKPNQVLYQHFLNYVLKFGSKNWIVLKSTIVKLWYLYKIVFVFNFISHYKTKCQSFTQSTFIVNYTLISKLWNNQVLLGYFWGRGRNCLPHPLSRVLQ